MRGAGPPYTLSGPALYKEFKPRDGFVRITFKEHWKPIRLIQKENKVIYTQEALRDLKLKKKKKKKK